MKRLLIRSEGRGVYQENIVNNFMIVNEDKLGYTQTDFFYGTCRDYFLTKAHDYLFSENVPYITCALVMPSPITQVVFNTFKKKWNWMFDVFHIENEELKYESDVKDYDDFDSRPISTMIFKITKNDYKVPALFWLFTQDMRKTFTGYSKIDENDPVRTSPEYVSLTASLQSGYVTDPSSKFTLYQDHVTGRLSSDTKGIKYTPDISNLHTYFLGIHSPMGLITTVKRLNDQVASVVLNFPNNLTRPAERAGILRPLESYKNVLDGLYSLYPYKTIYIEGERLFRKLEKSYEIYNKLQQVVNHIYKLEK